MLETIESFIKTSEKERAAGFDNHSNEWYSGYIQALEEVKAETIKTLLESNDD